MYRKKVTILGSTGSIGRSALEVIASRPERFEVLALTAGRNVKLLAEQIGQFRPRQAVVYSESEYDELKKLDPLPGVEYSCYEGQTHIVFSWGGVVPLAKGFWNRRLALSGRSLRIRVVSYSASLPGYWTRRGPSSGRAHKILVAAHCTSLPDS